MGRLQNNLNNAKARLDFCEYELSEEVKAKKIALSKKLYKLLDNEKYNNSINIENANFCIECEYYDEHLDYYNPNCSVYLTDVFAYDPELVTAGIDEVSIEVGKYLAYVNAGLTNEQAYELITIESKRQHELEMANKQLELERIKVEAQMRAGGVKQLLNR